jgi:hypothetical protein
LLLLSSLTDFKTGEAILADLEPNVFWEEWALNYRSTCYQALDNPLARKADRDLEEFQRFKSIPISETLE